ncbi:methyltransferase domain-containing protein [Methanobacterium sp. ACI-7]|uniref:methyltransferase domain-containing protein n=1 Tax=unclassified Methanobacterium TaxID=2627676 RepID=UPI0039C1780C
MCALKQPIDDLKSLKRIMHTNPYHFNLLSDEERITSFKEAIEQKARGTVYDIGAGCGILSILASHYSDSVYSVEINPNTAKLADFNFKKFSNIHLINKDARDIIFEDKADLIICEMLDTALIDEEQVPVINSIIKYLKDDGDIIPCKVFNGVEIISMDRDYICYEDIEANQNPDYDIMSNFLIYNEIEFKNKIEEDLEVNIDFKVLKKGIISGIKITTFTLLTEDIICGPTPMLNPPLLVPIEKLNVNIGDKIKISLSYRMGGGLNSIKTRVKRVS